MQLQLAAELQHSLEADDGLRVMVAVVLDRGQGTPGKKREPRYHQPSVHVGRMANAR